MGAGELGLAVEAPLAGAAVCARGAGVPHLEEPARLKPLINQSINPGKIKKGDDFPMG